MNRRGSLVGAGFALTALSYGLGRFAYGLLLPEIRRDLGLSTSAAGWIGGSAFAAYCGGIVLAVAAASRVGERRVAVLAGAMATAGLGYVAVAWSGWSLGAAIVLAGLSTGLTSPPLAAAVARSFDARAEPRANGVINSGTAAGIILSGLAVMAHSGGWRELYGLFAAAGAAVTVWLWFAMPPGRRHVGSGLFASGSLTRRGAGMLFASAVLMGAASTAIWTFGANIMRDDLGFSDERVALAWVVLGAAGTAGAGTGLLTSRFGIGPVQRVASVAMAVAIAGLTVSPLLPVIAFAAMALFGVAYIVSTGALLVWGIKLYPDCPDVGLGLTFLVVALGQTAGAPLFGSVWEAAGSHTALLLFAAAMAAPAGLSPDAAVSLHGRASPAEQA